MKQKVGFIIIAIDNVKKFENKKILDLISLYPVIGHIMRAMHCLKYLFLYRISEKIPEFHLIYSLISLAIK